MQSRPSLFFKTVLFALTIAVSMQMAFAKELSNHTARFVKTSPDQGPADPNQIITVKIHLQKSGADIANFIQQLHDPTSANFQKWLTPDQFKARFGASAGEANVVSKFLTDRKLTVVDSNGLSITVRGTVGNIQNALHTQLHQFKVDGNTVRANISNPVVDEPAGSLVSAISGLTDIKATPHNVRPVDSEGVAFQPIPLDSLGPDGLFFSPQCIRGNQTVNLSGVVANVPAGNPLAGQAATATYTGIRYGADNTNTATGTLPPCGYQPSELQTAYQFNQLFAAGLDGTGQTIVIVDAFGSPTLAADVALFDQLYGLPAANITTFNVNVTGVAPRANAGFATETTLDVEWAHAVAPGANIALVLAADNSFTNLNAAVQFAIEHHLGPAISNSYGAEENLIDDGTIAATEAVLAEGAAAGVSVNYSSGDDGDFALAEQALNIGIPPGTTTVSYPASSPFATAIGGTSLALNPDNTLNFQTGWGNNLTRLSLAGAAGANNPVVPPNHDAALGLGFQFGAGGGASGVFAKPHFQRRQPGDFRQLPDISYLADPFTGVEIIQTIAPNRTVVEVIGGTSLACPMFSALWTIAAQAAGGHNIGQAAQSVYELNGGAIDDIRPVRDNVTGSITIPSGTIFESAADLSAPLFNQRKFLSTLRQGASTSWFNLTFGTDSSLTVDNGWDNVTGLGTPAAPRFIDRLVHQLGH